MLLKFAFMNWPQARSTDKSSVSISIIHRAWLCNLECVTELNLVLHVSRPADSFQLALEKPVPHGPNLLLTAPSNLHISTAPTAR
jgi:hypothetical protein